MKKNYIIWIKLIRFHDVGHISLIFLIFLSILIQNVGASKSIGKISGAWLDNLQILCRVFPLLSANEHIQMPKFHNQSRISIYYWEQHVDIFHSRPLKDQTNGNNHSLDIQTKTEYTKLHCRRRRVMTLHPTLNLYSFENNFY